MKNGPKGKNKSGPKKYKLIVYFKKKKKKWSKERKEQI